MPDVSELHFTLDPELIAWEDWDALGELKELMAKGDTWKMRPAIAGFLLDADGLIMERTKAMGILGKFKVAQIVAVVEALMAARQRVVADAVPPAPPGS